ncbi:hypothetical protein [Blautia producta]|uniref:hypothetical protein n=1 Tax=Blautia producta TaxID=33035 RepID=UPI0036F19877
MQPFEKIADEVREEFQIPPYFDDTALMSYVKEGAAWMERLNPAYDPDGDSRCRGLLKNYVNYAYHHKINEFFDNYSSVILQWQLESEVPG